MDAGEALTQLQVQQWLDQEDAWMRDTVRRHGWAVQYVLGDACSGPSGCACGGSPGADPPFAYTVGLYGFGHPELLVYGLGQHAAYALLNELGERVRRGERLDPDRPLAVGDAAFQVRFVPFRDDGDLPVLISAQRFYEATQDRPVPALRVIWDG
ncbi:DUF4262 domain-containing protein [Jiangella rhizosphaerae]|uniref:DUF4262 domain-containing protein n=1 Tax=Jiangella rhizosphaerae TaxID=2293569 RepID=A0A418KHE6_9ACTN|nr:DUF4262 domain-containing protein [Jiangella rhizosphaerae]RIQ11666.1 DUF4262 domain-containing protein [Jiangella rhizosphaerae]